VRKLAHASKPGGLNAALAVNLKELGYGG